MGIVTEMLFHQENESGGVLMAFHLGDERFKSEGGRNDGLLTCCSIGRSTRRRPYFAMKLATSSKLTIPEVPVLALARAGNRVRLSR